MGLVVITAGYETVKGAFQGATVGAQKDWRVVKKVWREGSQATKEVDNWIQKNLW